MSGQAKSPRNKRRINIPITKGLKKADKNPKGDKGRATEATTTRHDAVAATDIDVEPLVAAREVEDSDRCANYCKPVLVSQRGLICDSCGFWYHATCEKVSDEIYNFLNVHDEEPSILWYCRKCVATCKKMTNMLSALRDQHQCLEDKFATLGGSLNLKLEEMNTLLSTKADKQESPLETRVEEKVNSFMEKLEKTKIG